MYPQHLWVLFYRSECHILVMFSQIWQSAPSVSMTKDRGLMNWTASWSLRPRCTLRGWGRTDGVARTERSACRDDRGRVAEDVRQPGGGGSRRTPSRRRDSSRWRTTRSPHSPCYTPWHWCGDILILGVYKRMTITLLLYCTWWCWSVISADVKYVL